jgi:hypothetical protein
VILWLWRGHLGVQVRFRHPCRPTERPLVICGISLREEIASGAMPLWWRSLPTWRGGDAATPSDEAANHRSKVLTRKSFVKAYSPDHAFPRSGTVAFEPDEQREGFAIKHLPPLPKGDQARWPCFFPSSLGMITVQDRNGALGGLSWGSTAVVSRHPVTVAICVSYAPINERYAPRASLALLEHAERFGCGVPIIARM